MSDISVSLDSSDIPVILDALAYKKAALKRTASKRLEREQHSTVVQIDLLINTLRSVQSIEDAAETVDGAGDSAQRSEGPSASS
jgi:hypothetical protein